MTPDATLRIVQDADEKAAICRSILEALPDWFGLPDALEGYIEAVRALPFLAAFAAGDRAVGFLALKWQSAVAVEAIVLGVLPEWHRRGIGRCLFERAEGMVREGGAAWLTVKTLAPEARDPAYERTRWFYEALGFDPIEVFETLWGPDNPCLLMLKPLRRG
jgi:GNAT superfamily N-acetyltransferase